MNGNVTATEFKFVPAVCERCGEQLAQIAVPKGSTQTSVQLKPGKHVCAPKENS